MRMHITLDDELVRLLDRRVGPRRRSGFIAEAVRLALDDEHRWELVEGAIGALANSRHPWDGEPSEWVRAQRQGDERRVG